MRKLNEVEQLFREHYSSMYKAAYHIVRDSQAAKDIVQDVFYQFWKSKNRIEIGPEIKGYLFKATVNLSINYVKKHKKHTTVDAEETILKASLAYNPFQAVVSNDLRANIDQAILKLPPKCQAIFMMSRYDGMKNKEIADTMGVSVKTVENQMGIALKRIKEDLAPYMGVELLLALLALIAYFLIL
ncbi:MAG: RNA polymerase sigma-70 factor [Bacteroidota bacterium]